MATLTGGNLDDTLIGAAAADLISGLAGNDSLTGNEGDDTLNGGTGADTEVGGTGNDSYVVDSAADAIVETGGDAGDRVLASIDIDLNTVAYVGIESVTLTGAGALSAMGNGAVNTLTGNAGANKLDGQGGNDTLIGGAGADTMLGGLGNDSYVVDSAADKISELFGDVGGDPGDRIFASIAIDLNKDAYDGIDQVVLTGAAALAATGDARANLLIGNAGANKLDGKGGVDTLIGGGGNDTYTVDDASDLIIEYAGEGIDTVISNVGELVTFTLGANIENVILGPDSSDAIGNALANVITANKSVSSDFLDGAGGNDTLIGNDGNDNLNGATGADSMVGGKGGDIYNVNDPADKIVESGPAGEVDTVNSVITYTLGANLENLWLLVGDDIDGTGNALANSINGNKGNNVLRGLAGNDVLNGDLGNDLLLGGDGNDTLTAHAGADTLVGGAGSDTFHFNQPLVLDGVEVVADFNGLPGGDKINFASLLLSNFAVPASDFIQTAAAANGSTTIRVDTNGAVGGANFVDMAVLQGVSTDLDGLLANGAITLDLNPIAPATPIDGTAGADNKLGTGISDLIRGLGGNDTLTGGAGFDTLDGGAGADSLIGGADSDTYLVDSAGDKIDETGGGTDDRILGSIAIDLNNAAYDGIEHVTLSGAAGLAATGDGFSNMLIGNAGANKLDGKGDVDTLIGGAGNDIYTADDFGDLVVENPGEGIDTVISTADFDLSANVENLTLALGSSASSGNGNALANKITGNAEDNSLGGGDGNDTLTGNDGGDDLDGGAGADSLVGGKGGDIYRVDNAGDKIVESGPAGETDLVVSSIAYTLGATIENLGLIGAEDISATGNSLNNEIGGNAGDNFLSGLAGNDTLDATLGEDTLLGGAGSDTFRFSDSTFNGLDVVAGFNGLPGGDKLDMSGLIGFRPAGTEADFIETAAAADGSTVIRVDLNGTTGGANFVDVAVLQGVITDLAGLLANGAIANVGTAATPPIDGTAGADGKLGTAASDLIRGLGGNDTLTGGAGFDTLDGGAGADSLIGGAGSDTYVVDSAMDKIDESGGGTDDRILGSIAIDLNKGDYDGIEHVTLSGAGALSATGDADANMLVGNAGANKLDGKGSVDTLIGGGGNDVYTVDDLNDVAIENPGEGIDTVLSTVGGFTLGADIENLTLAAGVFAGTGNALANKITGGANSNNLSGAGGNDTLIGNDSGDFLDGGAGADSMVGGKGGDFYSVDNIGDKIVESGPAGELDQVNSAITYTLGATLEELNLLGGDDLDGTGNALGNRLNGNDGSNVLSGLLGNDSLGGSAGNDVLLGGDGNDELDGHEGADTLVGGAGSDRFWFTDAALAAADVIADFNGLPGGDVIVVALLIDFDPGISDINDFLAAIPDGNDTVIWVDPNGAVGGGNIVQMAVLQGVSTSIDGLLANGSLLVETGPI